MNSLNDKIEWYGEKLKKSSLTFYIPNLFQTTLYKNGDITFVYIKTHENISAYSDQHLYDDKLEIGISDGFVQNGSLYMYHAISVPKSRIKVALITYFHESWNYEFLRIFSKGWKGLYWHSFGYFYLNRKTSTP